MVIAHAHSRPDLRIKQRTVANTSAVAWFGAYIQQRDCNQRPPEQLCDPGAVRPGILARRALTNSRRGRRRGPGLAVRCGCRMDGFLSDWQVWCEFAICLEA